MNLESWKKFTRIDGSYSDPLGKPLIFVGDVFGHPTIPDGTQITVTDIIGWDYQEQCFITPAGEQYRLKVADPSYHKQFPNWSNILDKGISARKFMLPDILNRRESIDTRKVIY